MVLETATVRDSAGAIVELSAASEEAGDVQDAEVAEDAENCRATERPSRTEVVDEQQA